MPSRPVETRSTTPHSQIASSSRPGPACKPAHSLAQVAVERILAHDDAEVVFGLSEQAVGINQLESPFGFERVPLMNVTVNEHGGLVAVSIAASCRTRQCVLDGALAARAVEVLPHRGDEFPEPPGLAGAGRKTAVRSGAPDPRSGRDQDSCRRRIGNRSS